MLVNNTAKVHFIARRAASVVEVSRLRLELPHQPLRVQRGRPVAERELRRGWPGQHQVVRGRELLRKLPARKSLHAACETTCFRY